MQESQCFKYFNIGSQNFVAHQNMLPGKRMLNSKDRRDFSPFKVKKSPNRDMNSNPYMLLKNKERSLPNSLQSYIENATRGLHKDYPVSKSKSRSRSRSRSKGLRIRRSYQMQNRVNQIDEEQCTIDEDDEENEELKLKEAKRKEELALHRDLAMTEEDQLFSLEKDNTDKVYNNKEEKEEGKKYSKFNLQLIQKETKRKSVKLIISFTKPQSSNSLQNNINCNKISYLP